jgi:hypothetical protein
MRSTTCRRHVGVNYTTGEYEIQIPGATTSGDSVAHEWIFVPSNVSVRFTVSSKDVDDFLETHQWVLNYTTGIETYNVSIVYYDSTGERYESEFLTQTIPPGEELEHLYSVTQNPDGTFNVTVHEGRTHSVSVDVKPESRKIVNKGVLTVITNITAVTGNINPLWFGDAYVIEYAFNDTRIIDCQPFGKIAYELYDAEGTLIEEGCLGDFNTTVIRLDKPVPENHTLTVKVHFKIDALESGGERLVIRVKIGAIFKESVAFFRVEG